MINRRMYSPMRYLINVFQVVFCTATLHSQQAATTRVEGTITDPVTKKPVGCAMSFVGPSGKKTSIKSSETDGSYLAVLNEAGEHKILIAGYNVYRAQFSITIPHSTNFQELKKDFQVRALTKGDVVTEVRGFELNSSTLSGDGKSALAALKETLAANQQMNVIVSVLPDQDRQALTRFEIQQKYQKDSLNWVKAYQAWEKKNKKAKVKTDPPVQPTMPADPEDPNKTLVDERIAVVASQLADVKHGDLRISIQPAALPPSAKYVPPAPTPEVAVKKGKPAAPKKQAAPTLPVSQHATLIVKVGEVKRLFD